MTAINAFLRQGAAYLFTDGATYLESGEPRGTGSKTHIMPQIPCALSSRGSIGVAGALALEINLSFRSFDDLAEGIGGAVERVYRAWAPQKETEAASLFELVIVGFSSARDRPEIYALFDYDRAEGPAFTPFPVGGLISPTDTAFEASLARQGINPRDAGADPVSIGLAVTRSQRDRRWQSAGGVSMRGVGGFCQVTVVERDRIETRILERWPAAA